MGAVCESCGFIRYGKQGWYYCPICDEFSYFDAEDEEGETY
jgi:uncharacterized Zn finger protein (UPF0148 family)